jgi:hypothetical protein
MDPVTVAAAAAAAAASETTAAATAVEANATAIVEGTQVAGEASEAIIGEQGLVGQLEAIKSGSLESVAARNETLLKTRNAELAGSVHPETGVPFTKEAVQLPDGTIREGVFPEFASNFETTLADELLKATDYQQAQYSNEQLRQTVESDPALKTQFNEMQLEQIAAGDTPDGFTWHHHQEPSRMQLVDTNVHMSTGHTGGKEIWGGGR